MIREREVIVGAQVDQFAAVGEAHDRLLRRGEHALRLEQPAALQVVGLGGQTVEEPAVHALSSCWDEARIIGAYNRPWLRKNLHQGSAGTRLGADDDGTATQRRRFRRSGGPAHRQVALVRPVFQDRGLAQEAVEGGHVQVNGDRVKASRHVKVGDRLRVSRERGTVRNRRDWHSETSRPGRRGQAALPRNAGKRGRAGAHPRAEPAVGSGVERPARQARTPRPDAVREGRRAGRTRATR